MFPLDKKIFHKIFPIDKTSLSTKFPSWQKFVCHKVSPLDKTTLSIKYSAKIFFLNHQQKPFMCQNILSESSAKTFHVPKYSFWTISINLSCAKIFFLSLVLASGSWGRKKQPLVGGALLHKFNWRCLCCLWQASILPCLLRPKHILWKFLLLYFFLYR